MGQTVGYATNRDDSHTYTDGVVAAEVTSRSGTFTGSSARARRGSLTQSEVSGGIAGISSTDTVWVVWVSTIGEATLEEGGEIRVGDDTFSILSAITVGDDSQVRCICRKQ